MTACDHHRRTLLKSRAVNSSSADEAYQPLLAANPSPKWVDDLETLHILEVNNSTAACYGYSRADFLAVTITDIRPVEDWGHPNPLATTIAADGTRLRGAIA